MGNHVDIRYTKVCAFCRYWNNPLRKHISSSFVPNHYNYDPFAREKCIDKLHDIYANQPACQNYICKFIK